MMYCLATGPKATVPRNHGQQLLKPGIKINLSFFTYLRYFVTAMEN
jgi:hypothetical protein